MCAEGMEGDTDATDFKEDTKCAAPVRCSCTTLHVQIEEFAPVREERGLGLHSGFGDRGGGLSRGHHHGREDEKNVLKHREVRAHAKIFSIKSCIKNLF